MSTTVETILLYTIAAGFLSIVYGFFTGKNILNQSAGNTKMQEIASAIQIGNPVSFKKAIRELKYFNGVVETISETDLMDWKAKIDSLGISICPNSAVAISGAMKLLDNGVINKLENVVVILTAHGSKFSNTAVKYHGDNTNQFANQMVTIEPSLNQLEKVLKL